MIGIGRRRSRGTTVLRPGVAGIARRGRRIVICEACELSGRAGDAAEARYLKGVHEQLHHGRTPGRTWVPDPQRGAGG